MTAFPTPVYRIEGNSLIINDGYTADNGKLYDIRITLLQNTSGIECEESSTAAIHQIAQAAIKAYLAVHKELQPERLGLLVDANDRVKALAVQTGTVFEKYNPNTALLDEKGMVEQKNPSEVPLSTTYDETLENVADAIRDIRDTLRNPIFISTDPSKKTADRPPVSSSPPAISSSSSSSSETLDGIPLVEISGLSPISPCPLELQEKRLKLVKDVLKGMGCKISELKEGDNKNKFIALLELRASEFYPEVKNAEELLNELIIYPIFRYLSINVNSICK